MTKEEENKASQQPSSSSTTKSKSNKQKEEEEEDKEDPLSIPFYDSHHVQYISTLASKLDAPTSYEGAVTEHLRMSGIYWSLTAMSLLRSTQTTDELMGLSSSSSSSTSNNNNNNNHNRPPIIDWIFACYDNKSGGFGGNIGHDGHLLYTLSALQILALFGKLNDDKRLNRSSIISFISSLQLSDGSFAGDKWGEVDTRFSYCALSALSLLNALPNDDNNKGEEEEDGDSRQSHPRKTVDVNKAALYIASCKNFDGGFGCVPGAESHAGQVFCCVGALSIAKRLDLIDSDLLCWWLSERQCDSGGLNGRPEKQADVCYSWWILSSLSILGRVHWINVDRLALFILKCQDDDDGGIADRPGDMPDVFHTFFGIAGLSLLGILHQVGTKLIKDEGSVESSDGDGQYRLIDPVYALPTDVVQSLGLRGQVAASKDRDIEERLRMYDVYES